ncbi:MAG TPA: TonB-dependent receptor [Novosphingobium sp.]|nr:TonB-dependent receptor [Novosphingobium sp.]
MHVHRYRLLLGAGAMALGLANPASAKADTTAQDHVKPADNQLGEIVVTAQKRKENLQVVPVAVSAISAEKIAKIGVSDARDLSGIAPNVTIAPGTTSNSAGVMSIRGISSGSSETFGLDAANGLYVDGIYIARAAEAGLDVADIERVEVLRGPQGTLFGRNTTGGAISFVSRKPSDTFRLTAEVGYGNYNAWNGKISVDPGEIAGIDTSFLFVHREREGVVTNLDQPDRSRDPGAFRSNGFRAAARAHLGTSGTIQYIFDMSQTIGSPMNFQLTNTSNGAYNAPISVNGQQVTVQQQAPVSQYLAGVTFANPACAALATPQRAWRNTVCNDITNYSNDKMWGHNLQVENDFGSFKLKSTTGYRIWHNTNVADLDGIGAFSGAQYTSASLFNGMPAALLQYIPSIPTAYDAAIAASAVPTITQNLFTSADQRSQRQLSQELELSGSSDRFDWVVGGFYFWEKGIEYNPQNSGYVLDTNASVFTAANFGALASSFAAANPAQYRLVQTLTVLNYQTTSQSEAAYAQATFYPGGHHGRWRLTLGGRYTWDQKSMLRFQNGSTPDTTPETGNANFSRFTWNAMLGYDFAKGITGYARVATGYRSGGFNAADPSITGTNTLAHFNPESVTSYEVGLKTELLDRHLRLNVAAYHNVYENLEVTVPVVSASGGTFVSRVQNAGRVHYDGIEADAQAILSRYVSIDGSIGYVSTKFIEFNSGLSTTGATVNVASLAVGTYSSPLTANIALDAHYPLGRGDARLFGRIGYTHEDGQYSFSQVLTSPFNNAIKGDARNLVDLQFGVDRFKVGTAEAQLKFWVKNLTDEHALTRGIDFGALGYAGGYYELPRTYGVSLGVKL